ncbi:MAG: MiaB/RimO family radical SAM methylthiotransferase [Oscillospiraceae bacterium]|nr:MiaB/RimO family radical SAM methylthiotransferase [Oscillospiraceae bacterium]
MNIKFYTLGCRVNQLESAAMEAELKKRGHVIVESGADAVVVNSCAVTAESARKSRQAVRRLMKENPGAFLAVCGCWAQAEPEEAEKLGAMLIGGSGDRMAFIDAMCAGAGGTMIGDPKKRREPELLGSAIMEGRTRAYLKVEDGCQNYCSYCIIPFLRGPVRSVPIDPAARAAAECAAPELTITGIELASYQYGLGELLKAVGKAAPDKRLRLGSLEPRAIDEEFCRTAAEVAGLCPHFHLSLQSGCDATLRRMGRCYDTARFYRSVELLREYFDNCGITADLITGFPGETEDEFAQTLEFMEKCAFSHVHIFPYSERKGTKAAVMENSVPKKLREERAARAAELAARMERSFLAAQKGSEQDVLFETRIGHTPNYCAVEPPCPGMAGSIKKVKINGVDMVNMTLISAI